MPKSIDELNSLSNLTGTEKLIARQGVDDGVVTVDDVVSIVLDKVFPVGTTYTQLPSQPSPIELNYPGTWSNISSSYAGDFFRVEGGAASAFETGRQNHQFQTHAHNHRHVEYMSNGTAGGTTTPRETAAAGIVATATNTGYDASNPSTGTYGTETRPVNQTIRIWKRTA